ncbi:MAG TPA: hypothetical protein PKA64_21475 [Myxococcota bacterium]|nr:hypothetical protein [Myxococcota bacterium]
MRCLLWLALSPACTPASTYEPPVFVVDPGDDSDEPPPSDTPTFTPEDTADGPTLPAFTPSAFYVTASFAYDPVESRAVAYTIDGDEALPQLTVVVFSETWSGDPGETDQYCFVVLTAAGSLPRAQWSYGFAGVLMGVSKPDEVDVYGTCRGRIGGSGIDADEAIAALHWGAAVLTDLDPSVVATLEQAGASDIVELGLGSGLAGDVIDALQNHALLSIGYALPYEVDDTFALRLDAGGAPILLARDAAVIGGELQRAVYQVDTLGLPWSMLDNAL